MMESAETGPCLWMVVSQNLYGIRIEKLEKLGKNEVRDWENSLESAPFDLKLKLPNPMMMMRHFVFDSKLFLAGVTDFDTKIYQISCVGDGKLKLANAEESAIPKPPTLLHSCYLADIQGDVYLVVHNPIEGVREAGLWVLSSRSRIWERLNPPPTAVPLYDNGCLCYRDWEGFTLNDVLFLQVECCPLQPFTQKPDYMAYVYNSKDDSWRLLGRPFSFKDLHFYNALVPVSSLGDVGNCSVALTWELKHDPIFPCRVKYDIHALLVDNKDDYCVHKHQCLNELFKGIQPSFFDSLLSQINIVDLGNSKVSIIISGNIFDDVGDGISVICMSVAELELIQEEEQKFLSVVRVLVNQVYSMAPHIEDSSVEVIRASFVSSLIKHPCSHDCISPMKQRNLAIGTNPSNPTTPLEQQ
ncbi:hypothetical protein PIB30_016559 [Stylosanthes scabra]|uniref:DUF1618 domain-containing protein n=1 Tax=Stylosanthes scabra TaxID=79078 RepID=A0ABU6R7P2_9FABA|nr:hypothetical protein [Stylosanthes scabra]